MTSGRGGSRWRKIRRAILVRDNYVCLIRGPKCAGAADTVDHIIEVARGGTNAPENLRAACTPCNMGRRVSKDPEFRPRGQW